MLSSIPLYLAVAAMTPLASAHIAFWHKSMFGFNVTMETFPYDNRPQAPLADYTFNQWWFHGHLDYPPHDGDFFELPAQGKVNTELSCDKGSTSWWPSSPGLDAGFGTNSPCIGQPTSEFHTTGFDDVKGCALAIAYKSNARDVQPEDFTVFSVNHTCVWYLNTVFEVPNLSECPPDGCTCAWFWIHSPDSGSEQNYMNGFKCKVTGATSTKAVGKAALPRRCGADPANGRAQATPSNCTEGPKQPFYWYQKERNNMFEGTYSPPIYTDLYNFKDGAQNDIFQEATVGGVPVFPGSGPVSVPPAQPSSSQPSSSSSAASSPSSLPAASSPSSSPAASSPSSSPAPAAGSPKPSPVGGSSGSSSPAPAPGPSSSKASSPAQTPAAGGGKSSKPAATPAAAAASDPPHSSAAHAPAPASTKKCGKHGKHGKHHSGHKHRSDNVKRHLKRRLTRDLNLH